MGQAGEATFGDFLRANGAGNLLAPSAGPPAPAAACLQQVSSGGGTALQLIARPYWAGAGTAGDVSFTLFREGLTHTSPACPPGCLSHLVHGLLLAVFSIALRL